MFMHPKRFFEFTFIRYTQNQLFESLRFIRTETVEDLYDQNIPNKIAEIQL